MGFIETEKSIRDGNWWMHEFHSHSHYEIYYLRKGSRAFFLSNSLQQIQAPNIVVIPPHVIHKTEGGAFERYNINVSANYLDAFEKEILDKKALIHIKPSDGQNEEILRLMNELIATDKKQKHSDKIIHTLFSYFLFLLHKMQGTHAPMPTPEKHVVPPLVLKVIDYLTVHYAEKQTLESLAENFFVSKATLIYNFKKYASCSPIDFLLNVRLTKAKELLLNTKKSVNEISEVCGFSSANYFGLIFKQKENLSPANYRKYQNSKV